MNKYRKFIAETSLMPGNGESLINVPNRTKNQRLWDNNKECEHCGGDGWYEDGSMCEYCQGYGINEDFLNKQASGEMNTTNMDSENNEESNPVDELEKQKETIENTEDIFQKVASGGDAESIGKQIIANSGNEIIGKKASDVDQSILASLIASGGITIDGSGIIKKSN